MNKRNFLKRMAGASASGIFIGPPLQDWINKFSSFSATSLAEDETFWATIRKGYKLKPEYINLENGYYCFMPEEILEKYLSHVRYVNYHGAHYMRTVQFENKKSMASKLAVIAGCSAEELIITRNTTESLDMIIGGQDWKSGDEAVMASQDYGAMLDMFTQVGKRYGVINRTISIPNHPASDDEIVTLYANAITAKTKLLMICHMVNITGQILPVQKICDMAHKKGVPVMVDGAHAFAHIRFKISDLHCDYYGASLHKWLSVPLGAGILYVKKEHINKVWPMQAEGDGSIQDISRLNHTGTIPVATDLAIADAIEFYETIGPERKEARLRYLQNYWTSKVRNLPNVQVNTPADPNRSCGIANVGIKGMKPQALAQLLLDKYKIFTVAIDRPGVQGCRITPNVYTTVEELDVLVQALTSISKS
jgi:selenocysteine lyase/cysteine desulfurase